MRRSDRNPQKKSVLLTAPGLLIAALAFGAVGGWTASDLLASWKCFRRRRTIVQDQGQYQH